MQINRRMVLNLIKKAIQSGLHIVNVTQGKCSFKWKCVTWDNMKTSTALKELGVISGKVLLQLKPQLQN